MVKVVFSALLVFCTNGVFAQISLSEVAFVPSLKYPQSYRAPGLLAASATLSPSILLNRTSGNFYLNAFAEYHLDRKISLRSDTYLFLNGLGDQPFLKNGARSYFGVNYHLNQLAVQNWDVKIGFQPGLVYAQHANYDATEEVSPSRYVLSPSFSLNLGADYYVWKYFHFFANIAYVNSQMRGLENGPEKLDELIFSAGLGFQIRTYQNKNKVVN